MRRIYNNFDMIEFLKKKCLGFPAFEIRSIITYVLHAEQLYKTKNRTQINQAQMSYHFFLYNSKEIKFFSVNNALILFGYFSNNCVSIFIKINTKVVLFKTFCTLNLGLCILPKSLFSLFYQNIRHINGLL